MSNTTESFTTLASSLVRGNTPWEGQCKISGHYYKTQVFGDSAYNTYTLDLKSGRMQMQVTHRADGSFLTRCGSERHWTVSSTDEVAFASSILASAAEEERRVPSVARLQDNVVSISLLRRRRAAAARWFGVAATRAAAIATFAFLLIALA